MKTNKEKLEALEDFARQLTKMGSSSSTCIGDDLDSVIQSATYEWADAENPTDRELADLEGTLDGELESLRDDAGGILRELKKLYDR